LLAQHIDYLAISHEEVVDNPLEQDGEGTRGGRWQAPRSPSAVDLRCLGLCIYILPIEKVNYMNSRLVGATAGILVTLVLICVLPAGADGREDKGDGLSRVVLWWVSRRLPAPGTGRPPST
jgi:hypothetical protein